MKQPVLLTKVMVLIDDRQVMSLFRLMEQNGIKAYEIDFKAARGAKVAHGHAKSSSGTATEFVSNAILKRGLKMISVNDVRAILLEGEYKPSNVTYVIKTLRLRKILGKKKGNVYPVIAKGA